MSITNDLMAGVAALLQGVGIGTWRPTGVYPQGTDRPIYIRASPASPDRTITVSLYPVRQQPWTRDSVEGLQVINRGPRGDSRPADDDADAIREALDGLQHVALGGRHVSLIQWQSGAPLGRDDNERWEISQNFYLYTARPSGDLDD